MFLRGMLAALMLLGCSGADGTLFARSRSLGAGGAPDASPSASGGAREVCVPGDTRSCLGPGACLGAQACMHDRSGWMTCDCGTAAASGGASGRSDAGNGGSYVAPDSSFSDTGGAADGEPSCAEPALYVLVDQSASMGCAVGAGTRWEVLKGALAGFARSTDFTTMNVGLGFFGTAASPPGSACTPASYAADVEIGPLSTNAAAIIASLGAHAPLGDTPTLPALESALEHVSAWKLQHPRAVASVVLITDGRPDTCSANSVEQVTSVAAQGHANGVSTYVVGVTSPGSTCTLDPNQPASSDLDSIASAGGTKQAVLIDTTALTVASELGNALMLVASTVSQSCAGTGGGTGSGGSGSGGANVGGVANTGGASATGGASYVCGSGEKKCGGICQVPAPSNGCSLTGCTPCSEPAPANGVLSCDKSNNTCGIICLSGYTRSGNVCVVTTASGGAPGAGGGGGAGGTCDPTTCPSCGTLGLPCCVSGRCGCPLLGIPGTCG